MSDEMTEARRQLSMAVYRHLAVDPDGLPAIVQAATAGVEEALGRRRERELWAETALTAALALLNGPIKTAGLKAHLEFCIRRYVETHEPNFNAAEREFIAAGKSDEQQRAEKAAREARMA